MNARIMLSALLAGSLVLLAPTAARPRQNNAPTSPSSRSTAPLAADSRQKQAEALRLNNLGAALMGQQKFAQAEEMFRRAAEMDPKLEVAELNRGIALLNLQRNDAARQVLENVAKRLPKDPYAWYNLGLLEKNTGQFQESLASFQTAAGLAPADADAQYFVGAVASQLNQYQLAVSAFEKALSLNPFHASAEFGLARAYQRLGNAGAATKQLARFQELTRTKLGAPITLNYGDQGALSLAQEARGGLPEAENAIKVTFVDATGKYALPAAGPDRPERAEAPAGGICFLDIDGDGLVDVYAAGLFRNAGSKFADVTASAGIRSGPAHACAAGDFDNDGRTDLALAVGDRIVLYRNAGDGTFQDVSERSGIKSTPGISSITWVDFDHDGDLDLYVAVASASGEGSAKNVLWRNNGNGTFTDWTAETALNGTSAASLAAVPVDFNGDRAIDILVTGSNTQLLMNPREGKWTNVAGLPSGSVGATILDFDNDGSPDIAMTFASAPAVRMFRNESGKQFVPVPLPDLHWRRAWGIAALDYDNDGLMDVVAVGETAEGRGEIRLLRNEGAHGFRDVSAEIGLGSIRLTAPRAVAIADLDNDGDNDVMIAGESGALTLLRNDGGNQNHVLRLALKGLSDNKSAVGTHVEVFAGNLYQKIEVSGAGYLGQSVTDLLVGLGKRQQADVVRLLWPTGVVQDEIEIAAGQRHDISEVDRRASSCPVLFAWDGSRYRFVTDMLGAGVIGHWVAPHTRNIPDPTEYVKVEGFRPELRQGNRLSFRLMEPMEEVVYLDQVKLLAIDHPAAAQVYPNEYFASNPPFPAFKVVSSVGAKPVQAWDDAGHDVTALLRARDRRYVAGLHLMPFKGFAETHKLEFDLGQPYAGGTLRLLLSGYIEYFTATSMYAADQAGVVPVAPYVEALDRSGRWVRVLNDMGFPAGLPRTITVDLSNQVPVGARRLRIVTNLQIYWDQILVDRTGPSQVRTTEVPLTTAQLRFHGYPRAIEDKLPGDLRYIYEDASPTGPYSREVGAYTRFGDVTSLLAASDDRFAVFGSGEEVALEFDASHLPPPPSGWTRDYFFFADGYEKDMDFYAADPLSVAPLPFHAMGDYPRTESRPADEVQLRYQLEFNDRFVGRMEPPSYRFRYPGQHTKKQKPKK